MIEFRTPKKMAIPERTFWEALILIRQLHFAAQQLAAID
jgi:hypothetical protein